MQILQTSIHLENIRLFAYHGVLPQERQTGAYFNVSLQLTVDFSAAMTSDNLQGTVSYADIYKVVKEEMEIPSQLLEHVAGRITERIYQDFPTVQGIALRLDKENPPMGGQCKHCGIKLNTIR